LIKIEILEEEKRAAVAEEDFGRAAEIAQEIRELRGESTPTPSSMMSTAAKSTSAPISPAPPPVVPTPRDIPPRQEHLSVKPPAPKAAPEPAQYRAAASMFDSMMDDFD
jgi:hypothetical protein